MTTWVAPRRLFSVVFTALVLALSAMTPVAAASASAPKPPEFLDGWQTVFSPNGDGVRDVARRPYRLSKTSRVQAEVALNGRRIFSESLGSRSAGRHVWTWNGRLPNGKLAGQGTYRVRLKTSHGTAQTFATLDLKFSARVGLQEGFRKPASVFPRSRTVHDAIGLVVAVMPFEFRRAVLTIRQRHGSVVFRRHLSIRGNVRLSWDARDKKGRPLKSGRYVAVVSGVDRVGNKGHTKPFPIWVSSDHLVWHTTTTSVVPADESSANVCAWSEALGCGDFPPCGTVKASEQFPGGLTYQSGVCEEGDGSTSQQMAKSSYFLPVRDAVRGVDSIRVAFSGASTIAGETDLGHLRAGYKNRSEVASTTGAQTPWVKNPYMAKGQSGSYARSGVPAGAFWEFWTTDDDSVDVADFTVRARYLVPKG